VQPFGPLLGGGGLVIIDTESSALSYEYSGLYDELSQGAAKLAKLDADGYRPLRTLAD
jgi:hypothetical protein